MKKIIFDNTAKGFPADENFMRATDEVREGLEQLCLGLFGDSATVILSGLELIKRGRGANITTTLSGGYVWAFGSLLAIEQQVWSGDVPAHDIWIGQTEKRIVATYENGESLSAYINKKGYVVVSSNPGMAGAILRGYAAAKRISLLNNTWRLPSLAPGVEVSVQATSGLGGLSLSGTATIIEEAIPNGDWLPIGNVQSGFGQYAEPREAIYVAAVEYKEPIDRVPVAKVGNIGYVRISANGTLSLYIDKAQVSGYRTAIIHINITHR